MIGFLVWGRVRIKIKIKIRIRVRVRVGVTFNVRVYHWSNCHRSKYCSFSQSAKYLALVGGGVERGRYKSEMSEEKGEIQEGDGGGGGGSLLLA